ncbi:hypothetical protein ACFLXC_03965, partial [Chloroflexota bacterium]
SDMAYEEELRRFYGKYQLVSRLMDCLLVWKQIHFFQCFNPISAATMVVDKSAVAHFWTDKPAVACPHCGSKSIVYDAIPYQALNCQPGSTFNIREIK